MTFWALSKGSLLRSRLSCIRTRECSCLQDCLYLKVEDIPAVREFPLMHHLIDKAMRCEVRLLAAQHRQKQKALAKQYRVLYEQWQSRCTGNECSTHACVIAPAPASACARDLSSMSTVAVLVLRWQLSCAGWSLSRHACVFALKPLDTGRAFTQVACR